MARGVAEETRALVATAPVAARVTIMVDRISKDGRVEIITTIIPPKTVEGPTVIHPLLANTIVQTSNQLK